MSYLTLLRVPINGDPYTAGHAAYKQMPKDYRELFAAGVRDAAAEVEEAEKLPPKFERARERKRKLEGERAGT